MCPDNVDLAIAWLKQEPRNNATKAVQDGRIYTELINGPFLYREKGTPEAAMAGRVKSELVLSAAPLSRQTAAIGVASPS